MPAWVPRRGAAHPLASVSGVGIENPVHLAFIAIVALLVLGPKRLPELARALGKGVREFREAMNLGAQDEPRRPRPGAPDTAAGKRSAPSMRSAAVGGSGAAARFARCA